MKYSFLILLTMFPFQFLWATGRTVGNGGDVIVCETQAGQLQSIELLDFYEGRVLKGIQTELGEIGLTIEQKIAFALERMKRVSPVRAERYAKDAASFFDETLFLDDAILEDIPDTGNMVIPRNCRVAQIANQSTPLYPDDKRYVIDRRLWNALDNTGRAGLILHEVIYREALELRHDNSVSVRFLNANLCSRKIEGMSVQQYTKFLQDLGFETTSVQGVLISLATEAPEFYANGLLKSGKVVEGSLFSLGAQQLRLRGKISFFSSGQPQQLVLQGVQSAEVFGQARRLSPYEMTFFESGALESATFEEPTAFENSRYQILADGAIHFYENGLIRLADVKKGWASVRQEKASVWQVLHLDSAGFFREGILEKPVAVQVGGFSIKAHEHLKFDSDNGLRLLTLAEDSKLSVGVGAVKFSKWWKISFYPGTEKIQSACLAQETELTDSNTGRKKLYPARQVLKFEPDGSVKSSEDRC
jgi:hypothetical protein